MDIHYLVLKINTRNIFVEDVKLVGRRDVVDGILDKKCVFAFSIVGDITSYFQYGNCGERCCCVLYGLTVQFSGKHRWHCGYSCTTD